MGQQPLALSDQQLKLVFEAAQGVPYQWRERFLASVADQLTDHDHVTTVDVGVAIRRVLPRFQSAPPDNAA